ncbi:UDP-2,3-diacylglucosamine diphosphatase [bacterium]|nr:UDP-2,3-diacylglucosamine diphosphatase [bacterium]
MTNTAYFLSDVHLRIQVDDYERVRRQELFLLLDKIKAEKATLFIVGDWFDFYFEYGYVVTQTYYDVYSKMRELVEAGVSIHFFGGNHDYWLGKFMSETIGVKIYQKESVIEFANKRFFILHGDGLDKDDVKYQRLQRVIRNPVFIWVFKWIVHPNIGHAIARVISRHSRDKYRSETADYLLNQVRKNYKMAEEKLSGDVDFVIMGHIHYPKLKMFSGKAFLTIGDFLNYYSYGYFDGVNLSLKQWTAKQLEQRELP